MRLTRLLLCLLTIGLVVPLAGQTQNFVWTPGVERAYADVLKLKIQPARQRLQTESSENGIRLYADDYADMLTLLFSDNEKVYTALANHEDQRLDQLRKLDSESPWSRVIQAEVRLHWAFVKLKFGKEVSACWDVIRAYRLLSENHRQFPDFLPTYKTLGVLHVMIGAAPDNYTWVASLLGLRGNIALGMQEIQQAQKDPHAQLEAQLIELMIRAYVLSFSPTDAQTLQTLVRQNPDNALLFFLAAAIQLKNGQSESARQYLLNCPTQSNPTTYLPMPIIDNLLGDIYLQKGQYTTALGHYQQFLTHYSGQSFLKDTYYKQFLCHWLNQQPIDQIRPLLVRVLMVGQAVVESDKAAQQFAERVLKEGVSLHQRVLMQARLSCDGGYLDTALAYLQPYTESQFKVLADKAEFNYRLGRIYQRRQEVNMAIRYLERAVALCQPGNSAAEDLSFGATAALQLGYLYQQKNDTLHARQYFEKALSYRHYTYKNSIDNKARAGLSTLSSKDK